jgi:hypothetical protein
MIGRTLMGQIKSQALNDASEQRGSVSQSVLGKWANNPDKAALMNNLLPTPQVQTFRNLASTVEAAKRAPVASTVNTSNTGSALVNTGLKALKGSLGAAVAKKIPGVHAFTQAAGEHAQQSAVNSALNPGVSIKSLLSGGPKRGVQNQLLSQLLVPSAVGLATSKKNKSGTQQ